MKRMKRMVVAAAGAFGESSIFVVIFPCAALISAAVTAKVDVRGWGRGRDDNE
jgi:hypothetical protein